ncbi:gliding motility lipoprotein GldH [Riemerella columbipharyngis]|uniref:Gliding motility-associated lipoprotein GldH n=1 Tax=Riemerella columbipharyngis TaxID=1071918 RepID=A0A1G7EKF8_9FLAO|nr:gliding motility lipoprotein GldH [Riemerella columbipharyngis]SDE64191.1 gliding motility-associated lipoprotein GldH [Riemerella columbipharyngis]
MLIRSLYFCIFLIVLFSCKQDENDFVQVNAVNGKWNKNKVEKFDIEIKNAQIPKNIIFVVRNNNNYPYNNIFLISQIMFNDKFVGKADTLNYILAEPNGQWLGSGFGDTKEILFQYKTNYKFPKNGHYTISVKQAMRADTLKGIEDFGIKIQSAK